MAKTREQIIQSLRQGRSVLHKGKLISNEDQVPGATEFEMTGEEKEAHRQNLQKQLDALNAAETKEENSTDKTKIEEKSAAKDSDKKADKK